MSPMRLPILAALLTLAASLSAQTVTARSPLNVRKGQSASSEIVDHLDAGESADLVTPPRRKGYLHVRTTRGITGWAWAERLDVDSTAAPLANNPPSNPPASPPANPLAVTTGGSAASSVDPSWQHVPTNAADIHWPDGDHALCEAGGEGGDAETNVWKNRTDEPASYHPVTWSTIATLPFPRNSKKHRGGANGFTQAELDQLARYEGIPISIEAYLSGVKEEIPSSRNGVVGRGESTNCGQNTSPRVDWHMYLTEGPNQSHKLAIVVETTPRVRPAHAEWTIPGIQTLSTAGTPVRISGWLMFDPEHYDQMWKYRGAGDTTGTKARITLWEIHPITKIEVKRNGQWVPMSP